MSSLRSESLSVVEGQLFAAVKSRRISCVVIVQHCTFESLLLSFVIVIEVLTCGKYPYVTPCYKSSIPAEQYRSG